MSRSDEVRLDERLTNRASEFKCVKVGYGGPTMTIPYPQQVSY